ncbi:hypothetical protein K7432_013385 [Basidiobolus ranarum]|uniref:S-adenosyl-L-methionine-dependent methyltransferase n=1 Tax=Basidiobolus ranarum TaxID=34480 RepID=A0ABR2VR13_9FUNG
MSEAPAMAGVQSHSEVINVSRVDEFYNKWADIYDHDGNVLQQIDDHRFNDVMPKLMSEYSPSPSKKTLRILDFGCGTGRNLIKLVEMQQKRSDSKEEGRGWEEVEIVGMEVSPGMMSKAQKRVAEVNDLQSSTSSPTVSVSWLLHDIMSALPVPLKAQNVDILYTTLVLEHLPELTPFFKFAREILVPENGRLYISNMHPDMGKNTRAGFTDAQTGKKVIGFSANHSIESLIQIAESNGFKLRQKFEDGVEDSDHAKRLGSRGEKWIGVTMLVALVFDIAN